MRAALDDKRLQLEKVFGQLKFEQQEKRAMQQRVSDAQASEAEAARRSAEKLSARLVAEANASLDSSTHPVFGTLLADFGYKRLYRASPTTLWAGTLMWDKQRAFRQERSELIAKTKAKSLVSGWPGTISVVEVANCDDTGSNETPLAVVIDGQHRLGAAYALSAKDKLLGALEEILVEVYTPMEDGAINELFTEINKVEPVTLIDLPAAEGGAAPEDFTVITGASERLRDAFKPMFKPSRRCLSPHLNIDVLRNELHKSGLLAHQSLKDETQLYDRLLSINDALANLSDAELRPRAGGRTVSDAALAKARANDFYLGLGLGWMHSDL